MKLHVGCGEVHLLGYKNIDIRYLPGVDIVDNATFLRKFQRDEIEEIYACHILEHFTRWEVRHVLERWYNLLKCDGGILRLSVPDFQAICKEYQYGRDLWEMMGLLYGGQDYAENYHHHCWDWLSLKDTLNRTGFKCVQTWDPFAQFTHDDYSKAMLPHMSKTGRLMSLNIKAEKRI